MSEENKAWYGDYDEGMHPTLEKFTTPQDLAKSYVEIKSKMGNSIGIPGKDAGEVDIKKFHDTLLEKAPGVMLKPDFDNKEQSEAFYKMSGRPEEAGKYEASVPEGYTPNEDRMKFLKEAAFEEGLSGKQFKNIMEKVHSEDFKLQQLQQGEMDKESDALKVEWGSAYDEKIDTVVSLSNKFFGEIFTKETVPPGFARGLDKISAQFSKEDLNEIQPAIKTILTPIEAQAKIGEIYGNSKHPFLNELDPLHESAIKRMVELQKLANPE